MPDPFDLSDYRVAPAGSVTRDASASASASSSSSSLDDLTVSRAPLRWLALTIVAGAVGAAAALLLGGSGPFLLAPWFVAGPVAILLLGVFSAADTRARSAAVYSARGYDAVLYAAAVLVVAVAVIVCALQIAFWIGRL